MPADPNARRLHLWTALILLAVFLAGAATGAGLSVLLRTPRHPGQPHGPAMLPPPLAELGLSPEQVEQARAIFERHRAEMEAAVQAAFPRVRAVQDQVDSELRAILTSEQAARLDAMRARRPPLPGMGPGGPGTPGLGGMEPPRPPPFGPPPGPPLDARPHPPSPR
jgi:Spy/CpxP family protein refolding chaperone